MEYEAFVRDQFDVLLRYSTALCGSREQGEDVLQEVLARALAHWPRIVQTATPVAYVRRMITNEFLSWHRKWGRLVPHAEVTPPGSPPDPAVITTDQMLLLAELARLPRRQRAVLVLRYYGGLDDTEIAVEMGCSSGTVRAYASRALANLRIDRQPSAPLPLARKA